MSDSANQSEEIVSVGSTPEQIEEMKHVFDTVTEKGRCKVCKTVLPLTNGICIWCENKRKFPRKY